MREGTAPPYGDIEQLKSEIMDELADSLFRLVEDVVKRGLCSYFTNIDQVKYDDLTDRKEKLAWTFGVNLRHRVRLVLEDDINLIINRKLSRVDGEKFIDDVVERIRRKQLNG